MSKQTPSRFSVSSLPIDLEAPTNAHSKNNSSAFLQEVEEYLKRYPNTQHIDVCLHDLGREFCELWHTLKYAEHQHVYQQITSAEKAWDL